MMSDKKNNYSEVGGDGRQPPESSVEQGFESDFGDDFCDAQKIPSADEIFAGIIQEMKRYNSNKDFQIVEKAYEVAKAAHKGQCRASGEEYVIHPLEVARILTNIEVDRETIAAAILHDVIEDTNYTYDDIARMFSDEIAMLVDGVTKLAKMQYTSVKEGGSAQLRADDMQADNYRKMFLAMSNDIRVIIIKIADRLHNLRTIKHMPPAHQKKKADETLDIFAPLAHRLGIAKIRYELEDLAFRYQNPDAYKDLKNKIQRKQSERLEYVQNIVTEINAKLIENNLDALVVGRPKHFFSIYKKMLQKDKTLDQIYDLFAVRVIVGSIGECYHVLGIVHDMYKPIPGRFKDYIAMPKPNMYQSIHNILIGPQGEPFEIQIKTSDMHRISEYGIASHWKYKEGGKPGQNKDDVKLSWLRQLMEWQRDLSDSAEFLSELKQDLNLFKDHVYCFSPKGAIVNLAAGSTPIDFAYAIHSAVGNNMVGAKVNGKLVQINTVLVTGDRVEILTSHNSKGPNMDWLKIAKTSQARTKINAWFRKLNREDNILRGRELLEKSAKKKNVTLDELISPENVKAALNKFNFKDWNSLCAVVGHGGVSEGQVINRLYEEYMRGKGSTAEDDEKIIELINENSAALSKRKKMGISGISIKGVYDMSVRFSKCCNPMPGDEIIGFVTRGRGVSVHRSDCINVINLEELDKQRMMPVEWHLSEETSERCEFQASLEITAADRSGLVADITRVLADDKINMGSINTRRHKDYYVLKVAFPISGKEQLEKVTVKLKKIKGVYEISRTTS